MTHLSSWLENGPGTNTVRGQKKFQVVTCSQSFHGRTLGGIAATGQDKVKIGFDPLLQGFSHTPFNDCDALRAAVDDNTAAILFEVLQGEGGIHSATPEFVRTAAELREKHDLLLMFDEVQCGIGRTGNWCGWRSILSDVEPDAVSWAKGLAGGFPMGAIWASDSCAPALGPGTHGSTFGGTPLGSAVALAVLEELDRCDAPANAARQEKRIRAAVEKWSSPLVESLRGMGLMLGFVLNETALLQKADFQKTDQPASIFLVNQLTEAGLLTVPAGTRVVRWLPRLNVTDEEVDLALEIFENTIRRIEQR